MEKLDYLLIDTDILIDAGRGIEKAIDFLDKQNKKYKLTISIITEMELIVGCRNKKELKELENFLENFQVIPLNPEVSQLAAELLKEYRLKSGLLIADALIAATAIYFNYYFATKNQKHFKPIRLISLINY